MFVTSNILVFVKLHNRNSFDKRETNYQIKLETIILQQNESQKIFTDSCANGNLKLAMCIYGFNSIDVYYDNSSAFRNSCLNGHIKIVVQYKSIKWHHLYIFMVLLSQLQRNITMAAVYLWYQYSCTQWSIYTFSQKR
jgi:hypothetical protein